MRNRTSRGIKHLPGSGGSTPRNQPHRTIAFKRSDLILEEAALFARPVSKDGRRQISLLAVLRDAPIEIGCCRFRHFRLPKSGSPTSVGAPQDQADGWYPSDSYG